MRKLMLFSIFSLLFSLTGNAQIKKVLHKTYEIDSVQNIKLDLVGEYEIIQWSGSVVLTETTIELYDANVNIFKFFLKEGRYDVDLTLTDNTALFVSHDKVRKGIKTADGQCWEVIKVRVFIPEDFDILDQTNMVRQSPDLEVSKTSN